MNRLNRKVEYALMALKHMSSKYAGQLTSVKEICAAVNIPFDATSRVMQQMAHHNLLKVEHGSKGGYMLLKDPAKISLLEIIEIIDGPIEVVRCSQTESDCEFRPTCNVTSPLQSLNSRLANFYQKISLAELLQIREFQDRHTV